MAYPATPIGVTFAHRRLASDTIDTSPRLSLHTRIDAQLNAGAAALRGKPDDLYLRVSWRSTTGVNPSGSIIPWDTVLLNNGGGWNAGTSKYTCPKSGVYLVSLTATQSGTSPGRSEVRLVGLDTDIYPGGSIAGGITQSRAGDDSTIPAFPVVASAGDVLYATTAGDDFHNQGSNIDNDRTTMTIQYLGATPGGDLTGTLPPQPFVPDLWLDGEGNHDLKMQRRFAEPMDALRPYIDSYGSQYPLLIASRLGGSTVNGGAEVGWSIDFLAGWDTDPLLDDPDGSLFTLPDRPYPAVMAHPDTLAVPALWLVAASLVSTAGAQPAQFMIPQLTVFSTNTTPGSSNGSGAHAVAVGRYGGSQISVVPYADFDPAGTYRCYLAAVQLAP